MSATSYKLRPETEEAAAAVEPTRTPAATPTPAPRLTQDDPPHASAARLLQQQLEQQFADQFEEAPLQRWSYRRTFLFLLVTNGLFWGTGVALALWLID